MSRPKIDLDESRMIELREKGWSYARIGSAMGVLPDTIQKRYLKLSANKNSKNEPDVVSEA